MPTSRLCSRAETERDSLPRARCAGVLLTGLNPQRMVTRGVTGTRVDPNAEKSVPIADLRAVNARHDADLRAVAERTGAKLLDVFPDVCGNGETCSPFRSTRAEVPDGVHLRTVFVREHLHFLDFLLM